jgi:hypothetical protein
MVSDCEIRLTQFDYWCPLCRAWWDHREEQPECIRHVIRWEGWPEPPKREIIRQKET